MSEAGPGTFHAVCRVRDIKEGSGKGFVVEGRSVAVFRENDQLHAVSDRCPHNGMPLHDGCVRNSVITCRWHGWSFHLLTGRSPDSGAPGDGSWIRVYAVRVRGDQVEVSLDAGISN